MLIATSLGVYGQSPAKTSNAADNWQLVNNLSDEFNSATPDWNKWLKTQNLPNTTGWKWDNDKNAKIVNNEAQLTMRHNTNNVADGGTYFKSGILKSKETFTTGYVEARIKGAVIDVPGVMNGYGVCPSFWLYSDFDRTGGEGSVVYCEIDVVELQQFDWFNNHLDDIYDSDHNLHLVKKENGMDVWYRPKQNVATQFNKYRFTQDPSKTYHIYGCEVNETEIIWYVDGVKIATKPNTYWYRPMNVTLSLGLRRPFVVFSNNANHAVNPLTDPDASKQLAGMPTTMSVDYVRVWTKTGTSTGPSQVAVTNVSVAPTAVTLEVNATKSLAATITPSNATNKNVTWQSNDTTVATVNAAGLVTAKKVGNATITVKTENGSKTAICAVTVKSGTVSPSNCNVAAWVSGKAYKKDEEVLFNGKTYKAKWSIVKCSPDITGCPTGWIFTGTCTSVSSKFGNSKTMDSSERSSSLNSIVYPNPLGNSDINIQLPKRSNANVTIYSPLGMIILQKEYSNQLDIVIPASKLNLVKGIYIVKLQTEDQSSTTNLIVN